MAERTPLELLADIDELLELFGAVIDPILERILPAADEQLGYIELAIVAVELRFLAEVSAQLSALPGNPAHN